MGCGWVSRLLGCLRVSHLDSALSKFVTFNPFILEPYPELEEVIVESCELVHSVDGLLDLSLVHRQVKKILDAVCAHNRGNSRYARERDVCVLLLRLLRL